VQGFCSTLSHQRVISQTGAASVPRGRSQCHERRPLLLLSPPRPPVCSKARHPLMIESIVRYHPCSGQLGGLYKRQRGSGGGQPVVQSPMGNPHVGSVIGENLTGAGLTIRPAPSGRRARSPRALTRSKEYVSSGNGRVYQLSGGSWEAYPGRAWVAGRF